MSPKDATLKSSQGDSHRESVTVKNVILGLSLDQNLSIFSLSLRYEMYREPLSKLLRPRFEFRNSLVGFGRTEVGRSSERLRK